MQYESRVRTLKLNKDKIKEKLRLRLRISTNLPSCYNITLFEPIFLTCYLDLRFLALHVFLSLFMTTMSRKFLSIHFKKNMLK